MDKLLEEANKKMKIALEKQFFTDVEVAQALLQGVTKVRKVEAAKQQKKLDHI